MKLNIIPAAVAVFVAISIVSSSGCGDEANDQPPVAVQPASKPMAASIGKPHVPNVGRVPAASKHETVYVTAPVKIAPNVYITPSTETQAPVPEVPVDNSPVAPAPIEGAVPPGPTDGLWHSEDECALRS